MKANALTNKLVALLRNVGAVVSTARRCAFDAPAQALGTSASTILAVLAASVMFATSGHALTTLTLHRLTDISQTVNSGTASVDTPVQPLPDRSMLDALPEFTGGLVADGVTPLIIKLEVSQSEFYLIPKFSLAIYRPPDFTPPGGTVQNPQIYVLDGAIWSHTNAIVLPPSASGTVTTYAYLAGIPAEDIVFSGTNREVRLWVHAYAFGGDSGGIYVYSNPFKIRKPPIVLVHGFHSDNKTWSNAFLAGLAGAVPDNFIRRINYGVNGSDNYVNTYGALTSLAFVLDKALADEEAALRANWAFTRYDVIGHSQGGVLARMLCAQSPFPGTRPFCADDNFNRGRFRRIITIGAPHNGSRLAYYVSQQQKQPGVYAVLPSIMKLIGILQPKFDPFGDQIREINSHAIDPRAKFHLITSTIAGGTVPFGITPPCYSLLGLTQPSLLDSSVTRGSIVLPLGSDGVVDLASQQGGEGTMTENTGGDICHALTPGAWFWGVGAGECETVEPQVATAAVNLLRGYGSNFGPFILPTLLDYGDQLEIETEVPVSAVVDLIQAVLPSASQAYATMARMAAAASASTSYNFALTPGASEPLSGEVSWYAEVFGPGGVSTDGVTVTPDPADSTKVTVTVDSSVVGDVVLYASYNSTTGKLIIGKPKAVVSIPPAGATLTGIELRSGSISATVGDKVQADIWAVYDNGEKSQVFFSQERPAGFSSSAPTVASVDASTGLITAIASGSTTVTASFMNLTGTAFVTVTPKLTATYQPDLRLGTSAAVALGDNIYNLTGAGQTLNTVVHHGGGVKTDFICIQNDGNVAGSFKVYGTPGNAKFKVQYLYGRANVTYAVTHNIFTTGTLAPGATCLLRAKIIATTPLAGQRRNLYIFSTSATDSTAKDCALIKLKSN